LGDRRSSRTARPEKTQKKGEGAVKLAVISDIHSNLEAFKTVLADVEARGVEKIVCLGDLVGYGPNPLECVDLMMDLRKKGKVEVCLLGNHDQATLFDPDGFNHIAESAIFWTRDQLERSNSSRAMERWDFLGEIPRIYKKGKFLFVHGSPRNPLNEYIFSDDVSDADKMSKLFALTPQYCFQGHTHVPGVFVEEGDGKYSYFAAAEIEGGVFPLDGRKLLVNVGSVGQPRDHNPLSCYVIVHYDENGDDNKIEYRRLQYDVEATQRKFEKIPELDRFLAQRIKEGR
jgi:predicted phosphodiesterase